VNFAGRRQAQQDAVCREISYLNAANYFFT
jgi:hypothetical protein